MVALGEFGRAQGLKGEIRLKSYTADPADIASYGPLSDAEGRSYVITRTRPVPGASADMLVVAVEGIRDRNAAEALNRRQLFVPRDRLPAAEDEDEFMLADLIGLAAVDETGTQIGTVIGVPNYGSGDLLDIRPSKGGPSALLPFTKAFVPKVEIAAGRIVVAPPEDLFAPRGERPRDG